MADYPAQLAAVLAAPDERGKAELLAGIAPPADGAAWPELPLPARPGRPADLRDVADPPRRRQGLHAIGARRRFLHAIWHIELSAVDLAVALCLRGQGMPQAFHADFLRIACEEAEHAQLVRGWLDANVFPPGSDPVHHRLWSATLACADAGEQLVAIPRFLEARGLDVSASLLPRLEGIDPAAHAVIARIYHDELGHVATGTRWHRTWCQQRAIDPEEHFMAVAQRHFAAQIPGPFPLDRPGRSGAGFTERELAFLS